MALELVPVLDLDPARVSAAVVCPRSQRVASRSHITLAGPVGVEDLIDIIETVIRGLPELPEAEGRPWVITLPIPVSDAGGRGAMLPVGRRGVVEVSSFADQLRTMIPALDTALFLGHGEASALGEGMLGAGRASDRVAMVTLGQRMGFGAVAHGLVHRWPCDETMKLYANFTDRAAEAYWNRSRTWMPAVAPLGQSARDGDMDAVRGFVDTFGGLAEALAPFLNSFDAQRLVVGGSIARSWDLIEAFFVPPLRRLSPQLDVVAAELGEDGPRLGAAQWYHS